MENSTFTYNYSAERNNEVEAIRRKYMPKEENKLEKLRRLDLRVQNAGMIESLCIGTVGALVFGIGMCFGLDVFNGSDLISVFLCGLGALVMIPAYPIYRYISNKTKAELTPEILRLSEEIIGS